MQLHIETDPYVDQEIFLPLCSALVRPHLEYGIKTNELERETFLWRDTQATLDPRKK